MRLTLLALAMMPCTAFAQEATDQSQSCPVGMAWSDTAGACAEAAGANSPLDGLGTHSGCNEGATREVMS